jgi:hydroxymethylbilane synthase
VPLTSFSDVGLFTGELERALLDGAVDLAVHSLKDLPTESTEGLAVLATPHREDPRDVLALPLPQQPPGSQEIRELPLPAGAVVGTSSLRRRAQLQHARPDLTFRDLRGNVDTRLRKLDEGQYDACVLAAAGLLRLGLAARATLLLSPELCVPAPGQGALAIQGRADRQDLARMVAPLHHPDTWAAVTAERTALRSVGGGCLIPLGALARVESDKLILLASLADLEGSKPITVRAEGDPKQPEAVGAAAADRILRQGGQELLSRVAGVAVDNGD